MPLLSVVICTHNPDGERLAQTLAGLRQQNLPCDDWELVVIDNASAAPLEKTLDLTWHRHGRVVREEELGLTAARLRGFSEARSELVVLVDDDNVLDKDYLPNALEISRRFPFLGIWGGNIAGHYEAAPEQWIHEYLNFLAVRTVERDTWGNGIPVMLVPGAGMVLRTHIGCAYARLLAADPIRRELDRKGTSLSSAGDSDLTVFACAAGYGVGVFTKLTMTHLIPASRLTIQYMERLSENIGYSGTLMYALWGLQSSHAGRQSPLYRVKSAVGLFKYTPQKRRIARALSRGAARARARVKNAGLDLRTWNSQQESVKAIYQSVTGSEADFA